MTSSIHPAHDLYPQVPQSCWARMQRRAQRFSLEVQAKLGCRRRHRKIRAGLARTVSSNQSSACL